MKRQDIKSWRGLDWEKWWREFLGGEVVFRLFGGRGLLAGGMKISFGVGIMGGFSFGCVCVMSGRGGMIRRRIEGDDGGRLSCGGFRGRRCRAMGERLQRDTYTEGFRGDGVRFESS